jgi:TfoX/Sxy family transcriptional regulator of competence genes
MNDQPPNPASLFEQLRRRYPVDAEKPRRGFGSDALTLGGRIFAALSHGKLLLKLPRERVDELVTAGEGEPFVLRGRRMREWVLIPANRGESWLRLADDAQSFADKG